MTGAWLTYGGGTVMVAGRSSVRFGRKLASHIAILDEESGLYSPSDCHREATRAGLKDRAGLDRGQPTTGMIDGGAGDSGRGLE